ncbi:MAG: hypothetical protein ACKOXV_02085 [Bacteroidota bacterium]
MNAKTKALLASYGRSVLGAGLALYLSGVTDPTELLNALVAALVPVAIRYINPNDSAFGRVPAAKEVEQALENIKPVAKTTPKKTTAKK